MTILKLNNHEIHYYDNHDNYIRRPAFFIKNLDSKYISTVFIPELETFLKRKGFTENDITTIKELSNLKGK